MPRRKRRSVQSEESRRQAEAVGAFLVDAFRRPDPAQDGREVKVADLLDRAAAKLDTSFAGSPSTKGRSSTRSAARSTASAFTNGP